MLFFLALSSILAYTTTKVRNIRQSRKVVSSLCELTGNSPFFENTERSLFSEIYFGGGSGGISLGCETEIDDRWLSSFENIVAKSPKILKSITICDVDFPSEALSKKFPDIRISNCEVEAESKRLSFINASKKNRLAKLILFALLAPSIGFLIGKIYVALRPSVLQSRG